MKLSKSKDRFANTFGKEFDLCTVGIPHYHYFHEKLVQILTEKYDASTSINVLEIGAGSGNLLCRLKKSVLKFEYVGVESSPIMYEQLQEKFPDSTNVTFILKDGLKFLNENNNKKFSVIINSWTFHNWNFEYRKKAIMAIYTNLDSNGILVNADKIAIDCPTKHKENYNWQIDYITKVLSNRPDIVNEWIEHYKIDEHPDLLLRENTFSSTLKSFGFSRYECIERQFMDIVSVAYK